MVLEGDVAVPPTLSIMEQLWRTQLACEKIASIFRSYFEKTTTLDCLCVCVTTRGRCEAAPGETTRLIALR